MSTIFSTNFIFLIGTIVLSLQRSSNASFATTKVGYSGRGHVQYGSIVPSSTCRTSLTNRCVLNNHENTSRLTPSAFALRSKTEHNNEDFANTNYGGYKNIGENEDKMRDVSSFDVHAARIHLESVMASSISSKEYVGIDEKNHLLSTVVYNSLPPSMRLYKESDPNQFDDFQLPLPPVMTSMQRRRKETEIRLLKELKNGDSSVEQLWYLWYNERGPDAAAKLHRADRLVEQGQEGYEEAQILLFELIKEYGVHWPEPSNRLANLYHVKGNLKVSEAIWSVVLAVKPWHFGAQSGMHMVYTGLGDHEKANFWKDRLLPGLNTDRAMWVHTAVKAASEKLSEAENVLRHLFGDQDSHAIDSSSGKNTEAMDWQ